MPKESHHLRSCQILICCFAGNDRYGLEVNRQSEENASHFLYNWQYFDKRNRLCHNMIMEHFEVHKELLEDLVLELDKYGPRVFTELPDEEPEAPITMDDFALIDEMSGLNKMLDDFMASTDMSEEQREKINARMIRYSGKKDKAIALNELRISMFGEQR